MAFTSGPRIGSTDAAISVTAGTATLVTGATGKRVRVYSYAIVCTGAGTVKFQSSGGSAKTGTMSFAANGGISCAPGDDPWFSTVSGENLQIVTSGAVEGHLSYVIEP